MRVGVVVMAEHSTDTGVACIRSAVNLAYCAHADDAPPDPDDEPFNRRPGHGRRPASARRRRRPAPRHGSVRDEHPRPLGRPRPAFMLEAYLAILLGLGLLTFGADRFVDGAAATANNLGIPPLLVGLTIVGFATSAPEMLVAAVAALNGNPSIAIGNALGSNIANIGLVIGVTAIVLPLSVRSRILMREFPVMFACLCLALVLCLDRRLDIDDGIILFIGLIIMMAALARLSLRGGSTDALGIEMEEHLAVGMSTGRAVIWLALGLGLLLFGSQLLVSGAIDVARYLGVSDLVIGLTIVAIGTSLPELAASVVSALKRESDIALGNVIGSNMFNTLGVIAVPAVLHPSTLELAVLTRDFPVMIGMSALLFVMAMGRNGSGVITRAEGTVLVGGFAAYQWVLYQAG